ncbi:MAG: helix-turn-helix domain-containing protein, partial [Desulfosarcinaceae bacterium]
DLYYRLRVFPIPIPPLRQRPEDIPALLQHFIQKKTREMKMNAMPGIEPGVLDRLIQYTWPGNARELENAVERELIVNWGNPLSFRDINPEEPVPGRASPPDPPADAVPDLDTVMAGHIRSVLKLCKGRVEGENGAARRLNIHPSTLRKRMRKLKIAYGRKAAQNKP